MSRDEYGKKRRSIGDKMQRARTTKGRLNVSLEWAGEWRNEQEMFVRRIRQAIESHQIPLAVDNLKQLEATISKRHDALPRVFERLVEVSIAETTPDETTIIPTPNPSVQTIQTHTDQNEPKHCIVCGVEIDSKSARSIRCSECQTAYNKARRNELTKAKYQHTLTTPPLPDTHVYLVDWARQHNESVKTAQHRVSATPHVYGAMKVRNPNGGTDVWAVSKNAEW